MIFHVRERLVPFFKTKSTQSKFLFGKRYINNKIFGSANIHYFFKKSCMLSYFFMYFSLGMDSLLSLLIVCLLRCAVSE